MSPDSTVGPPYRLETLGTLSLRGAEKPVNGADQRQQRRRLALLAILAASSKLGRSRDQLLLLLWPDSTEKKARHSLDQLLYAARTSLGDSVFAGVNPLRLDRTVISADVEEFEHNFDEKNFAAAVEHYRGPFLDGFYLGDTKEFEDWVETERRHLAARYAEALEQLTLQAEQRHDHPAVLRWREKLVDADPVSSRYATGLATAFVKAGDYAAAIAFADRYERTATRELGAGNVPDLRKVVREMGGHLNPVNAVALTHRGKDDAVHLPSPTIEPSAFSKSDSVPEHAKGKRSIAMPTFLLAALLIVAGVTTKFFPRAQHDAARPAVQHAASPPATQAIFNTARRDTHNIEAYELYVRGHDPVLLRSDSGANAGLSYFNRAVQLDSNFAPGYAGLAEMYARQAMDSRPPLPRKVLQQRAEAAARRAVLLDDSLAEGYAALGLVHSYWLLDPDAAERELQRAVELDSSVPHALEYLSLTHAIMGRNADAIADARRAVAADPLSPTARATYAQILYVVGRCDEALPILDSLNLLKPAPLRVAIARSLCFDTQHRWADAQAAVRKQADAGGVHAEAMLGLALGLSGDKKQALEIRSKIKSNSGENPDYYDLAIVSYGLGDVDDALSNLARAVSGGSYIYEILGPVFDSLHSNPRFKQLIMPRGAVLSSR